MTVLVNGTSGFIGSNFVEYFNAKFIRPIFRNESIDWSSVEVFVHLAGKAHDLINSSLCQEYYEVNTELTKKMYDAFLISDAKLFITLSSVKAVSDELSGEYTEKHQPQPITHYGKSKLLAEQYILSKEIPEGKRVYVLRPCMIHSPGNKGNLNLLYKRVSKRIPWPLGAFENKRSYSLIT
jgi:nucleoside-diphosphate-sugar epimerase